MSEHKQKEERLVALEEKVGRLEEILDTNSAVFRDSLELAELCIQALQRALDDSVRDGITSSVKTVQVEGERKVDYKAYLNDAMALRLAVDKSKEPETTAPLEQVVFEFGG